MKQRRDDERQEAPAIALRPNQLEHYLLGLQRLAGNQSVVAAVQRTLEVTGSDRDVSSMLRMLNKPSGLDLVHHKRTHQVSIDGKKDKPPSPALAAKLTEVIDTPDRVAKIDLGRKGEGMGFGAFPPDEANPVQELRIDQIEVLEKGIPGSGTAHLVHEITENFAATDQKIHAAGWDSAHSTVHPFAEAASNQVLTELQISHGVKPSGRRQTQYTFTTGDGARPRITWVEARENRYHLWDVSAAGNTVTNARTAPIVKLAEFSLELSSLWKVLPTTAAPIVAQVAELMTKNPSASVTLRAFSTSGRQATADTWYDLLQDDVARAISNSILASSQRFAYEPAAVGENHVVITINRPGP